MTEYATGSRLARFGPQVAGQHDVDSDADSQRDAVDSRRAELIAAAQSGWIDALTDLGGRNTLLYYKDRRAGTLDLAAADPEALERFEKTGGTRLTRLFSDADARD